MKTASAYILYQPLSVALFMDVLGGSLSQAQDGLSGDFDPDRSIVPLILKPRLQITDPDGVLESGEYSEYLIDCRWYEASNGDDETKRILSSNTNYIIGDYGQLTVLKNAEADAPVSLFFSCAWIDKRNNNTFRKTWQGTLSTEKRVSVNLSVELSCAQKIPVSPFRTDGDTTRKIEVTVRNGDEVVDPKKCNFSWSIFDAGQYEQLGDDQPFIEEVGTNYIIIKPGYIDLERLMVGVYLTGYPKYYKDIPFKVWRDYGNWSDEVRIERGKFIRPDVTEIEAKAYVTTRRGNIADPQNYFDITHIFTTNEKGAAQKVIAYGESVVVPASIAGTDPNVIPVFGIITQERTALRVVTIGGKKVTIDGSLVCMQIPKTT